MVGFSLVGCFFFCRHCVCLPQPNQEGVDAFGRVSSRIHNSQRKRDYWKICVLFSQVRPHTRRSRHSWQCLSARNHEETTRRDRNIARSCHRGGWGHAGIPRWKGLPTVSTHSFCRSFKSQVRVFFLDTTRGMTARSLQCLMCPENTII